MCGKPVGEPARESGLSTPAWRADLDSEPEPAVVEVKPAPDDRPLLLNEPLRPHDVAYLLDEAEEEKPARGLGSILLLLVGLILIGGFGYMYFLSGKGFSLGKSPAADAPATAESAATTTKAAAPVATSPLPPTPSPVVAPSASPDATEKSSSSVPAANSAKPSAAKAAAEHSEKTDDSATDGAPQPAPVAVKTPVKQVVQKAVTKAEIPVTPAPTPKATADLVAQAEKLIYGDGVPQDCDRGLGAMRPLAAAADPKAMVALGVLYTTGTCVPRDLPTAYSWYAKALHKTPDSLTLQQDMKQIWGQMTAPERQLAIRLSQ